MFMPEMQTLPIHALPSTLFPVFHSIQEYLISFMNMLMSVRIPIYSWAELAWVCLIAAYQTSVHSWHGVVLSVEGHLAVPLRPSATLWLA